MKFCPGVPEICRGQVHVPRKERRRRRIIIIIRKGAKTINLKAKKNRRNPCNLKEFYLMENFNHICILTYE
jgi:hypothetical protein